MSSQIKATKMEFLGFLLVPLFLIVGILQLWLGYVGIEDWLGQGWAIGAVVLAFATRLMFPLTVGTYLAVVNVFGYAWWVGAIVAAPGLLFVLPSLVMAALEPLFSKR
jgi:hypothetical protein